MTSLDATTLAAIRADAASHHTRTQPYCTSCVDDIAQLCDEIDRINAELAGLRDLLDGAVLKGQGYCGGRHWNGGTCCHPAGHPEGFPAHFGADAESAIARVVALLDEQASSTFHDRACRDWWVREVRAALRGEQ